MKKRLITILVGIIAAIGVFIGTFLLVAGTNYFNIANPAKTMNANNMNMEDVRDGAYAELITKVCLGPMEEIWEYDLEYEDAAYYAVPVLEGSNRYLLVAKVKGYEELDEWRNLRKQSEMKTDGLIAYDDLEQYFCYGKFTAMKDYEYEHVLKMVENENYFDAGTADSYLIQYLFEPCDKITYGVYGMHSTLAGSVLLIISIIVLVATCVMKNVKENKMQNLLDLMKERRSIKKYKKDVIVPEELINKVIEAGLYAASGRGKQSPVIIAVTNKELRDKIAAQNAKIGGFQEGFDPFYGAPVILMIIANTENNTAVYDGSLVLGNMMLMAHELGLGSCWIHRAKEEFENDFGQEIIKELGIQGDYIGVGHLALGYADMELPNIPPRKENRVYYIR